MDIVLIFVQVACYSLLIFVSVGALKECDNKDKEIRELKREIKSLKSCNETTEKELTKYKRIWEANNHNLIMQNHVHTLENQKW